MATPLSELQRQSYLRDGLVFPIPVLSEAEVQRYRAESDALEIRLGGKPRTVDVRQMHLHFPWAYELAVHPRILDAVESLLGPNILVWATELFAKHPQDNKVSIGWHKDRPYVGLDGGDTVSAWIALADSIPANGCMRAIPGPGRHQTQPPGHARRRTTAVEVDETQAIDVVLRAGEMSLHDVDIIHGSGTNHSDQKRIGFVVRYMSPDACPREVRSSAILARGRDTGGHFELVERPRDADGEEALRGMRESAARHFEAMLASIKTNRDETSSELRHNANSDPQASASEQ